MFAYLYFPKNTSVNHRYMHWKDSIVVLLNFMEIESVINAPHWPIFSPLWWLTQVIWYLIFHKNKKCKKKERATCDEVMNKASPSVSTEFYILFKLFIREEIYDKQSNKKNVNTLSHFSESTPIVEFLVCTTYHPSGM